MTEWNPFWTDKVKIENGGRYPLLLNRFHGHMEEYLIKSIVSTSDRLRYVSYCCWAIGDIEQSLQCKQYYEFEEAFKKRESSLALGTFLLQPSTKVGNYTLYGRDFMRGKVDDVAKAYDTSFSILPSNDLGAYGQYYKGTLQNWGLTEITEDGIIHLTDLGNELYAIMESTYQKSEYYKHYKGKRTVPGDVLIEWGRINQYDNITDDEHVEEREFYKNILFHMDKKDVPDGRRDTLMIYLECIIEGQKNNRVFDEQLVRNILYYQNYYNNDGDFVEFKVSNFLEDICYLWKIYEAQVYFRWWIGEYFKTFLRIIMGSANGYTLTEVIEQLNETAFNDVVKEYMKDNANYYNMKFDYFLAGIMEFNKNSQLQLEEHVKMTVESESFSGVAAAMLITIVALYQEWLTMSEDTRYIKIKIHYVEDFWFNAIMERIEYYKTKSIPEVLRDILESFIIPRHNMRMYKKRDLRRCWFTKSADKYQHQADATSIWSDGKYNIIYNFIYDMGITDIQENTITLTGEGKALYKNLRENYYEE